MPFACSETHNSQKTLRRRSRKGEQIFRSIYTSNKVIFGTSRNKMLKIQKREGKYTRWTTITKNTFNVKWSSSSAEVPKNFLKKNKIYTLIIISKFSDEINYQIAKSTPRKNDACIKSSKKILIEVHEIKRKLDRTYKLQSKAMVWTTFIPSM